MTSASKLNRRRLSPLLAFFFCDDLESDLAAELLVAGYENLPQVTFGMGVTEGDNATR